MLTFDFSQWPPTWRVAIPNLPLARAGTPEEVTNVVLFLASEAASYVTGALWSVDGGSGVGTRYAGAVVDDDPRYNWLTGRDVI